MEPASSSQSELEAHTVSAVWHNVSAQLGPALVRSRSALYSFKSFRICEGVVLEAVAPDTQYWPLRKLYMPVCRCKARCKADPPRNFVLERIRAFVFPLSIYHAASLERMQH